MTQLDCRVGSGANGKWVFTVVHLHPQLSISSMLHARLLLVPLQRRMLCFLEYDGFLLMTRQYVINSKDEVPGFTPNSQVCRVKRGREAPVRRVTEC